MQHARTAQVPVIAKRGRQTRRERHVTKSAAFRHPDQALPRGSLHAQLTLDEIDVALVIGTVLQLRMAQELPHRTTPFLRSTRPRYVLGVRASRHRRGVADAADSGARMRELCRHRPRDLKNVVAFTTWRRIEDRLREGLKQFGQADPSFRACVDRLVNSALNAIEWHGRKIAAQQANAADAQTVNANVSN
jgi:hypothetical protein